ncbi:MAG: ABC transporter permease subunit, partial [Glaciecola sp.]|nr:ABC transporter permease subunit [Glaciecola sp.]
MINTLFRFLNLTFITLCILVVLSFALAYFFPGDTWLNLFGAEFIQDQPTLMLVAEQTNVLMAFWYYIQALLEGEWGVSFATGNALYPEIMRLLPATLELSFYAISIALLLGIPLGFIAGMHYHKKIDNIFMSSSMVMYSFPVFWLALLLIL